eukprot:3348606-Pyramimonas_sp.AAC.1
MMTTHRKQAEAALVEPPLPAMVYIDGLPDDVAYDKLDRQPGEHSLDSFFTDDEQDLVGRMGYTPEEVLIKCAKLRRQSRDSGTTDQPAAAKRT